MCFCMYMYNMCLCDMNMKIRLATDGSILIDSALYLSSSASVEHVFVSSQETGQSEGAELLGCERVQCMPGWRDLVFTAAA